MKKYYLLLFLLMNLVCYSQAITFGKEYPVWSFSDFNNLQQTSDGGYILCTDAAPEIDTSSNPIARGYLVKMNAQGNTQWIKTYPKTNFFTRGYDGNSVFQTADGGYIIATAIYTPASNSGVCTAIHLMKTDNSGNLLWSKAYPGMGWSICFCIKQTSDLGYIVCGSTLDTITQINYTYLLKTDASGIPQWGKRYAPANTSSGNAYSVNQASDGGYIVAGDGAYGAFIMKTDTVGTIVWDSEFGVPGSDVLRCAMQTNDGGYIAAGNGPLHNSIGSTLLKFDSAGNVQWQKIYAADPVTSYDQAIALEKVSNGYILLQLNQGRNTNLLKTNINGDPQWMIFYEVGFNASSNAIDKTSDGGFVFETNLADSHMPNPGIGIFKTDSLGFVGCHDSLGFAFDTTYTADNNAPFVTGNSSPFFNYPIVFTAAALNDSVFCANTNTDGIHDLSMENPVFVFPNPSSGNFTVEINSPGRNSIHIEVNNILGQTVMENSEENVYGNLHESLDLSAMVDGIYFVSVKVDDRIAVVKKIIKQN